MTINVTDYGADALQSPVVRGTVGTTSDVNVRNIVTLPWGETSIVITESGAFSYDHMANVVVGQAEITNLESTLVPYSESGNNWNSSICSVPFPHYNPGYASDGRTDKPSPFGLIVVRRYPDLVVQKEDRGEQGKVNRTYAHWKIHFDPVDLSAPGPVIGEFLWKRDAAAYPLDNGDRLMEVTFLDGCSSSALVGSNANGYLPTDYLTSERYTNPFGAETNPPSRFFDSYVGLKVLIHTDQFDVGDERPAWIETPPTKSAILIFANGSCRDVAGDFNDPPMKLLRVHHCGSLADVASPRTDGAYLHKEPGSTYINKIQYEFLPMGLPYWPARSTTLGGRNFLYSNLYPERYVTDVFSDADFPVLGSRDIYWERATLNRDDTVLNIHRELHEQIYHTRDESFGPDLITDGAVGLLSDLKKGVVQGDYDWSRTPTQPTPYGPAALESEEGYGGRIGFNRFDYDHGGSGWWNFTATEHYRTEILGARPSIQSTFFPGKGKGSNSYRPGWFATIEVDDGIFSADPVEQRPREWRDWHNRPGVYKRWLTVLRAWAAPNHSSIYHLAPLAASGTLQDTETSPGQHGTSSRIPRVFPNPMRHHEGARVRDTSGGRFAPRLIQTTAKTDASALAKHALENVSGGEWGPFDAGGRKRIGDVAVTGGY